ncbi:MAG: FkbM family methyltransferase [Oscillatoriales cyanobacterium SM2_1_8]|nr:FkbM family methyltransferase [Oscillatoriales cyanobacterium SM2_1_8]
MTDATPVTLVGQPVTVTLAPGDRPAFVLNLFLNPQEFTQRLLWQALAHNQPYEPATSFLFCRYLRPGDRAVDVGAHVGYYTLLAASLVGATGQVLACELALPNFQRLSYHLQINNLTNVQPVWGAIGDRTGEVSFFVNADNDGGHALWDVGQHPFNQQSAQTPHRYRRGRTFGVGGGHGHVAALATAGGDSGGQSIWARKVGVFANGRAATVAGIGLRRLCVGPPPPALGPRGSLSGGTV